MAEYMRSSRPAFRGTAHEIVSELLAYAADSGASDIHVEPMDRTVRIRLRRDGVLVSIGELPAERLDAVTARIKILASLDIANKRLPQDGRFVWQDGRRPIDMRVSTMPTIRGEKTVIRLLDAGQVTLNLDCLGLGGDVTALLRRLTKRSSGLFLYSGATGSGKTTTLYAALQELHRPEVSIATLEDPVEYKLEGVCQSQIHVKCGLEFHNGLRALLRQDPDILVIGEIRDVETARIAIRAALTGHLVFSTLHAASAAEAPVRLIDMGIAPYLVADALIGITSQRLVRRLCSRCRRQEQPGSPSAFVHQGCGHCFHSGYDGRFCLCEVLPVGEHVKARIRKNGSASAIAGAAALDGAIFTKSLVQRALAEGWTDAEEIGRVYNVGGDVWT